MGSLLTLASLDRATAQDQGASPANTPTTDTSTTTPDPNAPAAAPVEPLPPDTNPNDVSRALVPGVNQNPANPTPTNIPGYQAQLGNPLSPFTSTTVNSQSPLITQPGAYLTGNRDLSNISTSNALQQAFAPESVDLSSEDSGPSHEHAPIERIKLGPFDLKAAMVANATYDDNVRTGDSGTSGAGGTGSTGSKHGDLQYGATPAVLLEYGDQEGQKAFASLIYAPNISRYYHETNQNNIGQNVALNGIYPLQKLTFNGSVAYSQTTGVNSDSNVQTTQNTITSGLGAGYEVDDKISVSAQLSNVVSSFSNPGDNSGSSNASNGQGDTTTSVNLGASYRLTEKLTVGPGVNVGWERPDNQQKSTFEQGLGSLNYAPTEKIGMYAQAGVELRQYDQGGGNTADPIFAVGVGYNPFDSTSVSISANESTHASTAAIGQATSGQSITTTSVGASITQRIVQRFFVEFSFTYSHDDAQNNGGNTGSGTTPSSGDDTLSYRPSVSYNPTAWSSVSVYYQYLTNQSNIAGQSYNDNQLGLSVTAQF